ncbi:uncharacterized protein J4E88_007336 [Alternaria novae-zelandiae]|uniref:uncharacterized protein n=1 Tax=Alternaria novae-zelandiae TaxID=430562 RepID=UPI0020C230DB|nr:uncharacterized protein J4E88_007336 [Alternaria novae-zelandiae]KAI4676418.1 hypothetical protein J4E88_007336 [Alternaria novae-zelandiae]
MSFMTATLTDAEIDALSSDAFDHDGAIRKLDKIMRSLNTDPNSFIESIRVKNTLDAYVQRAKLEPTLPALRLILNCEYKLWKLAEETPMKHKVYLSHWIEALQEINNEAAEGQEDKATSNDTVTAAEARRTRAEYIMGLLLWEPSSSKASPHLILDRLKMDGVPLATFDLEPYMCMLVETEVWDELPEPKVRAPAQPVQKPTAPAEDEESLHVTQAQEVNSSQSWDEAIIRKLKFEPEQAVQELAHLPLELSSLEFLTKLHTNHTFVDSGIDGQDVTIHFIQHAMRLIEKMEAPPSTSQEETTTNGTTNGTANGTANGTTNGSTNGVSNGTPIVEYGKDAQRRAVMILLLFIKSSITKGFVEAGALFYELQEICIRYIWIKEVRDFKAWTQGQFGVN